MTRFALAHAVARECERRENLAADDMLAAQAAMIAYHDLKLEALDLAETSALDVVRERGERRRVEAMTAGDVAAGGDDSAIWDVMS